MSDFMATKIRRETNPIMCVIKSNSYFGYSSIKFYSMNLVTESENTHILNFYPVVLTDLLLFSTRTFVKIYIFFNSC